MDLKEKITLFLSAKHIAVAGVSRNKKFGNTIFKHLKDYNFEVIPVNPYMEIFDGIKCFNNLNQIELCDAVVLAVNKSQSEKIVKDALQKGIKNIWFQSGSASDEAIRVCEDNELNYIVNECIIMYTEPVKGFHLFHRWINKLIGKYPN